MKIETLAEQLEALAIQKRDLEIKEEVIKEALLAEMLKSKVESLPTNSGKISIGRRRSYIYTEAVKKLQDKIKIKMEDEVKQGLAEEKVTEYVQFRINKDK